MTEILVINYNPKVVYWHPSILPRINHKTTLLIHRICYNWRSSGSQGSLLSLLIGRFQTSTIRAGVTRSEIVKPPFEDHNHDRRVGSVSQLRRHFPRKRIQVSLYFGAMWLFRTKCFSQSCTTVPVIPVKVCQ